MGRTAWTEPQCLYSRAIPLLPVWAVRPVQSLNACTVQLYLYPPSGLYGLYRASVPVQNSYNSTPRMGCTACTEPECLYSIAIPLLPLWAVQPGQTLSACTVQLYLYSPYGPYGLYRASVSVQGCSLPWPLPLNIIAECPSIIGFTATINIFTGRYVVKKISSLLLASYSIYIFWMNVTVFNIN